MQQLSTYMRSGILKNMKEEQFDLVVIGGGITGAGIALDASARGMKVLLIEKYDFASGTSSKSTKLIHGGLRYLKQLEFKLVRDVGIERAVIHRLAPHLVIPVNMLLPIYKGGSLGKFTTSLALRIYDFLAKVEKSDRFKMLSAQSTLITEPLLSGDGLLGGAMYKEYRTDDARLTIELIKTAAQFNAVCINYVKAEGFKYENKKINRVLCRDLISGESTEVACSVVINAAGPWVDEVRTLDEIPGGKRLQLTKGIHIVVDHKKMQLREALYFDVPGDKRMIFTIPRGGKVYIGTTDTIYEGDKDNIQVTDGDMQYLLNAVNRRFPSVQLQLSDIESWWAGLRTLIHEEGKSPSELSRKDEVFISENGLISIAGGKLTGYRKMAEKAVNLAVRQLKNKTGKTFPHSGTGSIKIHGSAFDVPIDEYIHRRAGEAKQIGAGKKFIEYLVHTYGTDAEIIIDHAFEFQETYHDISKSILAAELKYTIEHEMVCNLCDFFIRRTGRLYFDSEQVAVQKNRASELITEFLQLSEQETFQQLRYLDEAMMKP